MSEVRPLFEAEYRDVDGLIAGLESRVGPLVGEMGAPEHEFLGNMIAAFASKHFRSAPGDDETFNQLFMGCTPVMKMISDHGIAAGDSPASYAGAFSRILSGVLNGRALHGGDFDTQLVHKAVIFVSSMRQCHKGSETAEDDDGARPPVQQYRRCSERD
jgi:hypothetical protein